MCQRPCNEVVGILMRDAITDSIWINKQKNPRLCRGSFNFSEILPGVF